MVWWDMAPRSVTASLLGTVAVDCIAGAFLRGTVVAHIVEDEIDVLAFQDRRSNFGGAMNG